MIKTLLKKTKHFLGISGKLSEFIVEPTYFAELNNKANQLIFSAALLAMVSWIPFMLFDIALYPEKTILIFVRLIVTFIGTLALILTYFKKIRQYSYYILFFILLSVSLLSGLILGLVKGDPIYMGGYSVVLIITPFIPLMRIHSIIVIFSSLVVFFITGIINGMEFATAKYLYGLFNVMFAFFASLLAVYFFDRDRKASYGKSFLIQQTNEALEYSNLEISTINKQIEKSAVELSRANTELKDVVELKSEFLHIAAHDLKNPLQIILGYVEMLKLEFINENKDQTKLRKIERSIEQMIEIILKLLELEKIDAGKYKIKKVPVIINNIIKTVMNKSLIQTKKKDQLMTLTAKEEIKFEGDPFILQQVFENLVSNAIKFSPPGSKILIHIEDKTEGKIISVIDEGPGLTENDQKNLFKKFKKLSAKPTGNENSSGLGLSIVKRYVEMHNGNVYAVNNEDKGSTFVVEFDHY